MAKKLKHKWTKKPQKEGWYWARAIGSDMCGFVGWLCRFDKTWYFEVRHERNSLDSLWQYEFYPTKEPK